MTSREALHRLVAGVRADTTDYGQLRVLLEQHFDAALRHHTDEVVVIVDQILELTAKLGTRCRERAKLVRLLSEGRDAVASIRAVTVRLPPVTREKFDAAWNALEDLVQECKRLNERNTHLLVAQHDIMQRVLHAEPDTYGPA
jgi:flagella synthesis protein FlgN